MDIFKQQWQRTKDRAKELLVSEGFEVSPSPVKAYDFIARRAPLYTRLIKITRNKISESDIESMRKIIPMPNETKEIWCLMEKAKGIKSFKKIEIKDSQIIVIFDPSQKTCQ